MPIQADALQATVTSTNTSGICAVASTEGIYLGTRGWLTASGQEPAPLVVTAVNPTSFQARIDTYGIGHPANVQFSDLSAYNTGSAVFYAPAQLIDGVEEEQLNDGRVMVDSTDTGDYLQSKLLAGTNVTITAEGSAGNRKLRIAATGGGGGGTGYADIMMSSGWVYGGEPHVNVDNTKFDVDAGFGYAVDNFTTPANPVITPVTWTAFTGITPTYVASADTTYLSINSAGNLLQSPTPPTPEERRDNIQIGWIEHSDFEHVDFAILEPEVPFDVRAQLGDFFETFGSYNVSGNVFSPGSSPMCLLKSAGETFDPGTNAANNRKSPNIIPTEADDNLQFWYYWRDALGDWTSSDLVSQVDPDQYDTGTGLASVPAGKWTVQPIMQYAAYGGVDIQYGQIVYETYADAISGLVDSIIINPFNSFDTFRGWLIVQQGQVALTSDNFREAGKLGLISVASGGGSGGEVNIASNHNLTGVGVFSNKVGVDLQFKGITGSSRLSVTNNIPNVSIDLDVVTGSTSGTICAGDDSRLSDARTPTAHAASHGFGQSDAITLAQSQVTNLTTDLAGKVPTTRTVSAGSGLTGGGDLSANRSLAVVFGSSSGTVCQGDDSRLTNARTPTAHASSHGSGQSDAITLAQSQVTNLTTDLAGKVPTTRNVSTSNGLTGGGALSADLTLSPTYGTLVNTVCQGNDSRLSDARTPTAHATSHKNGGTDEIATATPASNAIPKADASGTLNSWISTASTTVAGKVELATDGESASGLAVQANDTRLSNSRTPTSHASTHVTGGGDTIADAVAGGNSGLMSGAMLTKLNGIASGATNTPLTSTAAVALGSAAAGTSSEAARQDHVHPTTGLVTTVNGSSGAITNRPPIYYGTGAAPSATGLPDGAIYLQYT